MNADKYLHLINKLAGILPSFPPRLRFAGLFAFTPVVMPPLYLFVLVPLRGMDPSERGVTLALQFEMGGLILVGLAVLVESGLKCASILRGANGRRALLRVLRFQESLTREAQQLLGYICAVPNLTSSTRMQMMAQVERVVELSASAMAEVYRLISREE